MPLTAAIAAKPMDAWTLTGERAAPAAAPRRQNLLVRWTVAALASDIDGRPQDSLLDALLLSELSTDPDAR